MASGTIRTDAVLFAVPQNLLLNLQTVLEDPRMHEVMESIPEMHESLSGLAVYLIQEALNKTSFWRPYLCSLPRHVPLPLFYSPKKLERETAALPEVQRERFEEIVEGRRDVLEVRARLATSEPSSGPAAHAASLCRRHVPLSLERKHGRNESTGGLGPFAFCPPAAPRRRLTAAGGRDRCTLWGWRRSFSRASRSASRPRTTPTPASRGRPASSCRARGAARPAPAREARAPRAARVVRRQLSRVLGAGRGGSRSSTRS